MSQGPDPDAVEKARVGYITMTVYLKWREDQRLTAFRYVQTTWR